jgi:hypothetical protein
MGACERIIGWLDRHPCAERVPLLLALVAVVVIGIRAELADNRADDRDAARAYQRCEQIVPPTQVVAIALDLVPALAARVDHEKPGLLRRGRDGRPHLEVPDCARVYPRGAAVSHRYPDVAPTRPTP